MDTLYPDVEVQLTGEDGNAFFIIGRVMRALRQHGVPRERLDEFQEDAMSGDYAHVIATCTKWVTVL